MFLHCLKQVDMVWAVHNMWQRGFTSSTLQHCLIGQHGAWGHESIIGEQLTLIRSERHSEWPQDPRRAQPNHSSHDSDRWVQHRAPPQHKSQAIEVMGKKKKKSPLRKVHRSCAFLLSTYGNHRLPAPTFHHPSLFQSIVFWSQVSIVTTGSQVSTFANKDYTLGHEAQLFCFLQLGKKSAMS